MLENSERIEIGKDLGASEAKREYFKTSTLWMKGAKVPEQKKSPFPSPRNQIINQDSSSIGGAPLTTDRESPRLSMPQNFIL